MRSCIKSDLAEREFVLELLERGWTASMIAARLGRGLQTVTGWATVAGVRFRRGMYGGAVSVPLPEADPAPDRGQPRGHGSRLDACDRGQIATLLGLGMPLRQIAAAIGVHPSSVSREVRRHLRDGVYSPRAAQRLTDQARGRPKPSKLDDPRLRAAVVARLNRRLSPQQIAAELVTDFPDDDTMRVSHETIYQALYVQGRGSLRQELRRDKALRSGRTSRIPMSRLPASSKGWLKGHHISTRPAQVEDRAVPGHWEGDLIIGAHHRSAVITLVERQTRYAMMRRELVKLSV